MLLALDIGNTNITDRPVPGRRARCATRRARDGRRGATADELELLLDGLLRLDGDRLRATSTRSRCASVVPALTGARRSRSPTRRDRPLLIAAAGTVPLAVRVDRPGEVGADRLRQRARRGSAARDAGRRRRLRDGDDARLRRAPTAPTSAAPSRRGSSSGSRRSRRGPPSCHGSSCAPRTGRSAGTP